MELEPRLETVLKQLKFLRLPVRRGSFCGEGFWQFGKFVGIALKICGFVFVRQLLKGQQIWSTPIVAGMYSLRNCGWLVGCFFFCIPEAVLGKQYVTFSWTPVNMSWPSAGQSFLSSGSARGLLQEEDHYPHSFPGLCHMRSGTSPQWFRGGLEVADSLERLQDVITRLIRGFLFY